MRRARSTSEPCCTADACEFSVVVVGFLRQWRARVRAHGEDPIEAAYTVMAASVYVGAFGGGRAARRSADPPQIRWADRLVDLERAEAAGCVTDLEISAYLCPFSSVAASCYTGGQAQPCPDSGRGC